MKKITFVCDNINNAVLFLRIGDKEIFFDDKNTKNQIAIMPGTYDMLVIYSKHKNFDKYSALGHRISFKFLLPYKDKNYFNHLCGWENKINQCIATYKVKIKNDTLINIVFEEKFSFNYFESKDYYNRIKITQNDKFKILATPNQYIFYSKGQKNKYYFIQILLVFLYYFIGVFFASAILFEAFVDINTYRREQTIIAMILLITIFLIRFFIYLHRIIKNIYLDDLVLKT